MKRVDVKLINNKKRALKLVAKPNFKHYTIHDENLGGTHMRLSKVKLKKPSYLGIAVLDLSKTLMYNFMYKRIERKKQKRLCFLAEVLDELGWHMK